MVRIATGSTTTTTSTTIADTTTTIPDTVVVVTTNDPVETTSVPAKSVITAAATTTGSATTSKFLGNITRIHLQQQQYGSDGGDDTSFIEFMGIPTFMCIGRSSGSSISSFSSSNTNTQLLAEQEDALPIICTNVTWYNNNKNNHDNNNNSSNNIAYSEQYGPAYTLENVLSTELCQDIITSCEDAIAKLIASTNSTSATNATSATVSSSTTKVRQQQQTPRLNNTVQTTTTTTRTTLPERKNQHGAIQLLVSSDITNQMAHIIAPYIPIHLVQARKEELDHHTCTATKNMSTNSTCTNNSKNHTKLVFVGLNRRFRIYKYLGNNKDHFKPHIDIGFPPSGLQLLPRHQEEDELNDTTTMNTPVLQFDDTINFISSLTTTSSLWQFTNYTNNNTTATTLTTSPKIHDVISRLTILFYLNDNFVGGTTNFYEPLRTTTIPSPNQQQEVQPQQEGGMNIANDNHDDPKKRMIASVQPKTGMCLIFPQCVGGIDVMDDYCQYYWPTHEGSTIQQQQQQSQHGDGSSNNNTSYPLTATTAKYVIRSDLLFAEISD